MASALPSGDNTIVIFTSDNGGERFSDTWPFTGRKTELLEGGLRIPAIIRWPGVVASGQSCDQTMITMDWLPTLLAAAGTSADPAYPPDGENLLPVLRDPRRIHQRTLAWRYLNLNQEASTGGFQQANWQITSALRRPGRFNRTKCLVPAFDGVIFSHQWKDAPPTESSTQQKALCKREF